MSSIPQTILNLLADPALFRAGDVTVGVENEWQVCVCGDAADIDLVQTIRQSSHYRNLVDRARSGDVPRRRLLDLDAWLEQNTEKVWENSWVRLPEALMNPLARACLQRDLLADKQAPQGPLRSDAGRFMIEQDGERLLRVPVSYLLKLALLQAAHNGSAAVRDYAIRIQSCFLNDNTSPEICSFYPVPLDADGAPGVGVARETARRFLLTQLLAAYANTAMGLADHGQRVIVYASPHPPVRQKRLNELVSDAFYRDLFMSPCLSGWNDGEGKHRYMRLCHEVLSRSQLNAVLKMREAGIIQNNLVVLPTLSNTGLANNGIHISIGSRLLSQWMADPACEFKAADEKQVGDLVTKIVEYFLPLFVGTFSASPFKLDFVDFHPERILGFLPHELDGTRLRMLWRRWKKKGRFKILGRALTPFGPPWLDRGISRLLRFKGDFVPDFRVLDYPVALLSTSQCPGLDGNLGNDARLLEDLVDQGVYDHRMPVYRLWRLRDFASMGFCGFEARYYSQFADTLGDMPAAVCVQVLITALAYRYIARGDVSHADIPDTPQAESERRQIFFGAAAGIPTFYVRRDSDDRFMQRLLERTARTRPSRRYPGSIRVKLDDYRQALLQTLRADGADLIRDLKAGTALDELEARLVPRHPSAAANRLSAAILSRLNRRAAHACTGDTFNGEAERYYREDLRRQEMARALGVLQQDCAALEARDDGDETKRACAAVFDGQSPSDALERIKPQILAETLDGQTLEQLIHLLLLVIRSKDE